MAPKGSDNFIQPNDQQTDHEETKEKVEEEEEIITFMEYDVYSAAEKGEINPIIEQRKDSLRSLLTPGKNTILHIYLTSKTSSKDPATETDEFVEGVLRFCPALLMQVNTKEETLLHFAARYGHASIVEQLINHAKEDQTDHHNQDHENHGAEAAKKMLRMESKEGDTALHEAVRFGHRHVVEKLIAEDGDLEHKANKSGETPLYMAVERGYNDIAKEIIGSCNSPATGGPNGRNVLHAATIRKDKGMIESILDKFGEQMLKQPDRKGWTPLHCAAYIGNSDVVEMFLKTKMGREAAYLKTGKGNTALHLANVPDDMKTMLEILKWCPDSSELVNKRGRNILHLTVQEDRLDYEMKEICSRTSLSNLINEKDDEGNTPLHHIAFLLRSDLINFIDNPRVDKWAFNNKNENVLDLASTTTNFAWREKSFKKRLEKNGLMTHMRRTPIMDCEQDDEEENLGSAMQIHTLRKDFEQDDEEEHQNNRLKKVQDANAIVAALIATVTFTAGFAVPGGFVSEEGPLQGTPILGKISAFKTFMVMDTIAMVLSTSSVLTYLFVNTNLKPKHIWRITLPSFFLTFLSAVAMVVAFATGTYAMLGYSTAFSIVICVLAFSFFILFWYFSYKWYSAE